MGQRLRLGRCRPSWTIVGIVGDVEHSVAVDAAEPQMPVPLAQRPCRQMSGDVRTSGDPEVLVGTVRDAVAGVDAAEPTRGSSRWTRSSGHVTSLRTTSRLVSIFGVIRLLLAGVGAYGVVSSTSVSGRVTSGFASRLAPAAATSRRWS